MALHMGTGPGHPLDEEDVPFRVYHGPAFRWVLNLADPYHLRFVIAGGNGGRPDSKHLLDHYPNWLGGDYYTLTLKREEMDIEEHWKIENR
jgi:acyl-homoserine lactone acylase PvdQ